MSPGATRGHHAAADWVRKCPGNLSNTSHLAKRCWNKAVSERQDGELCVLGPRLTHQKILLNLL